MKNRIITAILAIAMVMSSTVVTFASSSESATENSYGLTESQVMQERDQIDGGLYADYADRFSAMGLTFDDVKSLQNQGYSYDDILQMPMTRASKSVARAAAPSNFVRVTNVAGSTEYYHPNTGMVAGDFYDDNDGDWIEGKIEDFVTNVYGSLGGSYMYYLWGEWDTSFQTHQGNDQYQSDGDTIYSAHSGEVIGLGSLGRICIFDEDEEVTYIYAHCQDIQVDVGDHVDVGDPIGAQGSVGVAGSHLHFEVRTGDTTAMGLQNKNLNTLNPYDYM